MAALRPSRPGELMATRSKKKYGLTYGEIGEGKSLFRFLKWMHRESIPAPADDDERARLILRYLMSMRQEDFEEREERLWEEKAVTNTRTTKRE
jgi:hypothetical protein